MTTRWPRASSACTKPRSSTTWGHGKPPPGSRPPPPNGPAGTTPRGSCGAPAAARRANTSRPGATAHSARSPPAARAAGPAGHQKEAAMAAAHYPGGLRPHPPGLRPGPRPSSEMAPGEQREHRMRGIPSPAVSRGAAEPPPRSRAPPASQAMTLRVTLDQPGEPAAQCEVPDEEMPKPRGGLAGAARHQAGSWTAQPDRCSITKSGKNDQTVVPPGGGTVEDNDHPDQSIWGESSLHQTRGAPPGRAGQYQLPSTRMAPPVLAWMPSWPIR
jgi:hypothetical protein